MVGHGRYDTNGCQLSSVYGEYGEYVRRMALRLPAVGIDIGGTKIAAGVVDGEGTVVEQIRTETPHRSKSPKVVEDVITELVLALADRHDVHAVGIGAAGFVDAQRARVLFAPHLSWRNEPIQAALSDRLKLPVVVENDANAAAWAEWRFGAGADEERLVMVNLGTGIGGAIVRSGRLDRGRYGMAGEFGHMTVVPGGHRCPCGNRGCWEQYSSGNALVREARELAAAESPVAQPLLDRVDGDVGAITGPLVTEAARDGDPCAVELLQEIGNWLGLGLANLAAALDPGRFVIGGGVSAAGELLLGPAREAYRRNLTGRGFRPECDVVGARLGNTAGMIGAADLARGRARRFRTVKRSRVERTAARRRGQWWTAGNSSSDQ
ncbi:glucokinase [Streptacidiphilus sp. MAP5-52]